MRNVRQSDVLAFYNASRHFDIPLLEIYVIAQPPNDSAGASFSLYNIYVSSHRTLFQECP
jgi:hypothetical protein